MSNDNFETVNPSSENLVDVHLNEQPDEKGKSSDVASDTGEPDFDTSVKKREDLNQLLAYKAVLENQSKALDKKAVDVLADIASLSAKYCHDNVFLNLVNSKLKVEGCNERSTDTLTDKLLKLVVGTQRRSRNTVYRRVLHKGLEQNKTGTEFTDWVKEQGGLEEIAYDKKSKSAEAKMFKDAGKTIVESSDEIAQITIPFVSPSFSGGVLLLGEFTGDGHVRVIHPLLNEELLNRAYVAVGRTCNSVNDIDEIRKKLLEDEENDIFIVDEHEHEHEHEHEGDVT